MLLIVFIQRFANDAFAESTASASESTLPLENGSGQTVYPSFSDRPDCIVGSIADETPLDGQASCVRQGFRRAIERGQAMGTRRWSRDSGARGSRLIETASCNEVKVA